MVGRDNNLDVDDLAPCVRREDGPIAVWGRVRALGLTSSSTGMVDGSYEAGNMLKPYVQ